MCSTLIVMNIKPLSGNACALLQQLLDLDVGDGVVIERDVGIEVEVIAELQAHYCIECHPLCGAYGGQHIIVRRQHSVSMLQGSRGVD